MLGIPSCVDLSNKYLWGRVQWALSSPHAGCVHWCALFRGHFGGIWPDRKCTEGCASAAPGGWQWGAVHLGRAAVEVSRHVVELFKGRRQKARKSYEEKHRVARIMYNVMWFIPGFKTLFLSVCTCARGYRHTGKGLWGERHKLLAVAPSDCGVGMWARGVCAFHFLLCVFVFFDIVYIVQEC